ncbi:threonine ammonia-lyase [Clostridium sp. 19966]|uniref:threonine ammonia-lyase n=1 Tax=Clostridium sp. 19966 TaxID=2768166 RepID=UPI0028DDC5B6|nr:threonine ammonia-lyase [Clostridium sp. 19966]MDT8716177.1 threonine ammonia-lyase [Clostridium sp. 19966]
MQSNSNYTESLKLDEFKKAAERLNGVLKKTSLIYSNTFSSESGNEIYIKPENLQNTGSFKIRGAYNKISKLSAEEKSHGLIASSAGNHAQGVAFAAEKLGVQATIVMPKTTPLIKVDATRKYGAEVVLHGNVYDEAYSHAKELEKEKGYTFIHPFDDVDVILGQGTIALEIIEELKDVDYILAAVGGGGLISGLAVAAKSVNPNIKVIGVEPEGASCMKSSLVENKIVNLGAVKTIADGAAVAQPGNITFEVAQKYVDDIITVSDFEIMEAFLVLLEKHKLIAENAGVLPLAGIKKLNVTGKKVACVVSGGNIDVLTISSLINKGLVSRGRIFCFTMELTDRPGQLMRVCDILAKTGANIIQLDHNKYKTINSFMQVQLEVTVETNGHEHVNNIINELCKNGFCINKIY